MTTYTIRGQLPDMDGFIDLAVCPFLAIANFVHQALTIAHPTGSFKIDPTTEQKGDSR